MIPQKRYYLLRKIKPLETKLGEHKLNTEKADEESLTVYLKWLKLENEARKFDRSKKKPAYQKKLIPKK
jgi:hypothetical protein